MITKAITTAKQAEAEKKNVKKGNVGQNSV